MSSTEDPPRWSSATSGLPDHLVVGLEEARGVAPGPEQMARMRSGLGPILALGAAATVGGAAATLAAADAAAKGSIALGQVGAASGASSVGWGVVGAKVGALLVVLGGVTGVAWVLASRHEELSGSGEATRAPQGQAVGGKSAPMRSPQAGVPLSVASPLPEAPAPAEPLAPPQPAQAPPRIGPSDASGTHSAGEKAGHSPGNSGLLPEARVLGKARGLLQASPAEALRLCRQHQTEFPKGVLAQEREVIATEALVHLGRLSEARQRVVRFRKTFSGSPHLPKLEALVSTQQPLTQ